MAISMVLFFTLHPSIHYRIVTSPCLMNLTHILPIRRETHTMAENNVIEFKKPASFVDTPITDGRPGEIDLY